MRNVSQRLGIAFPLLLAICLSSVAGPARQNSARFAWLSDTHIGSSTAEEDLRRAVADINHSRLADFVLVSGDVTEYGSWEQLRLAREILKGLRVPCYVIPGNHDTKWSESGATDFVRLWEADRFVFEAGGCRFIGIHQGPLMRMGDGHWAPQDVRWLRETLESMPNRRQPIIFVTHYPIDAGIANWYAVLDLLKQYNTQAVLCGHGHSNRKLDFEGIAGVMGRSNLRGKRPAGGFNYVEVAGGRMTFSEAAHGGSPQEPWHAIKLGPPGRGAGTPPPRPDYSVNERYPEVRPAWKHEAGYTIASSPAVWKNLAIVGDAAGKVAALDLDSGKPVWAFEAANAVYSTPAVSGNTVVFASASGVIHALNAATGKPLWARATPRPIVACPLVVGGRVYIGSSEGKFRALNLRDGKTEWEFAGVKGFVETRPVMHDSKVIFGAWDQHLYALDAASGKLAWRWKGDKPGTLLSPAACWPVAAAGKVFIVAPDRQMTALRVSDGSQVWRSGAVEVRESIGLSDDGERVYVRAMRDLFCAFASSAEGPQKVWETNAGFGYDINSAMLVEKDGVLFYGTKNGLIIALEAATGRVLWQHKLGPGLVNTLVPLSAKAVLATDFDGTVALVERQGASTAND